MELVFTEWPKIARLKRPMTITEKLDGTNAAVGIVLMDGPQISPPNATQCYDGNKMYAVYAQSRTRIITPDDDNFGFANWVWGRTLGLVAALGPGVHFGEWWGSGIQRGYGLKNGEKNFSLFNSGRFNDETVSSIVPGLHVVPVLRREVDFSTQTVMEDIERLRTSGSFAAPGFMRPEGVVVYHHGLNGYFKVTLEKDEAPKSVKPQ